MRRLVLAAAVAVAAAAVGAAVGLPLPFGGGERHPDALTQRLAPEFDEPGAGLWYELQKPVERYFYLRKRAIVERDMKILWDAYPRLREQPAGQPDVNAERDWLRFYPRAIDGNHDSGAERMLVKETKRGYDVFVHGWEMFVFADFEKSGGELFLTLSLEKRGGRWTVVRTDEVTEGEYHRALDHD